MGKRDSNQEKIEDVINKLIKSYGLTKNYDDYKAIEAFKSQLGPTVVNYTEDIYVKNRRLYVKLRSAVMREELSHGKSKIVDMINRSVGKTVILDVVLV